MRSARMAAGSARMSREQERADGMQGGEKGVGVGVGGGRSWQEDWGGGHQKGKERKRDW